MRKLYNTTFIILFLSFFLSNSLSAQGAFGKGDVSVNAGFSLGLIGYGYAGYGTSGFPLPLTANVEFALNDRIGVAPYAGFLSRSYGATGDLYRFTSIAFGGQADLHLSALINNILDQGIDEDKVDYYVKLVVGYETYSWTYNGSSYNDGIYNNSGRLVFGPVIGVRYLLLPHFGVYAEGGRGVFGWLTLGASLKI